MNPTVVYCAYDIDGELLYVGVSEEGIARSTVKARVRRESLRRSAAAPRTYHSDRLGAVTIPEAD